LDNEKGELSIVYFVAVLIIAVIVIVVCHWMDLCISFQFDSI
jgi:uncharacterized protein HemY